MGWQRSRKTQRIQREEAFYGDRQKAESDGTKKIFTSAWVISLKRSFTRAVEEICYEGRPFTVGAVPLSKEDIGARDHT